MSHTLPLVSGLRASSSHSADFRGPTKIEEPAAFDKWPAPQGQQPIVLKQQTDPLLRQTMVDPDLIDHLMFFNDSWFPVGTAFAFDNSTAAVPGQPAPIRLVSPSDTNNLPVAKMLTTIDNQIVLIESVNYPDLQSKLKTIQQAALPAHSANARVQVAQGRKLPPPNQTLRQDRPLQMASAAYAPRGLVLDYVQQVSGSQNGYTFTNGTTYCISNSFSVGPGTATFQQNSVVKCATNAYLLLYGPVSFPSSGVSPVFTSVDDNAYGDVISGSTSIPNYAAAKAIWMYFDTNPTTIQNVLVRWAQKGIEYDENSGSPTSPTLSSSSFQFCNTGVYLNTPNDTLTFSLDTACEVVTPVSVSSGFTSGSITTDCGVVSVALVNDPTKDTASGDANKNSQSECSFVQTTSTNFVAAFFNTHLSEFELGVTPFPGIISPRSIGWSTSTNGGGSFVDQGALSGAPSSPSYGDAGDPIVVRDKVHSTLYILGNPSRETGYQGFRLWKSTDVGQSFSWANTNVPSGFSKADKPMLVVNNNTGLSTSTNLYVAGEFNSGTNSARGIVVARSADAGATWVDSTYMGDNTHGADIAIASDGTVYVFYLVNPNGGLNYSIQYRWKQLSGTWQPAVQLVAHSTSTNLFGVGGFASAQLLRQTGANTNDYFDDNGFPRVAVNPANNHIFVVYNDLPSSGSTSDRGDIFIQEGTPGTGGALTWSGAVTVNNDRTTTDQWCPSVSVNPAGTRLFVGYYSRQKDTTSNAWTMAYAAKADISRGFIGATFDTFPIRNVGFTNLFPGTTASTPSNQPWLFDNVWAQDLVSFDTNADVTSSCNSNVYVGPVASPYQHFMADDYTWTSADASYFYFAWRDCTDPCTLNWCGTNYTRVDPNVRFGKIKQ